MSAFRQALLSFLLLVGAAGGWYLYTHPELAGLGRETGGEAARPGGGAAGPGGGRIPGLAGRGGATNVITAAVEAEQGGETVTALGTAKAARSVTLFPQVDGMVTEIPFAPGEPVEAGEVLLRLDSDEQRVALDRARVTLAQAQGTLKRSQTLAKSKTITAVALSEAETAAQLAEIEVRAAEIALARREVAAPFGGVTGLTDLSVGDLVSNTTAVTTLDDVATVRVAFEVPERWASLIVKDQPIVAAAQGVPGSEFPGRIVAIDNRIDEVTRTLRLEAELGNETGALKTGMAMNVTLTFDGREQLAVPTLSVQWDRRGSFVWKVVDGAAERAEIAILRRESGAVIVSGAVAAGDRIVVEGIQRLRPGSKVVEVGADGAPVAPPAAETPAGPAVSGAGAPARERG
jgi:RND family efflux transporter MFP subunit